MYYEFVIKCQIVYEQYKTVLCDQTRYILSIFYYICVSGCYLKSMIKYRIKFKNEFFSLKFTNVNRKQFA